MIRRYRPWSALAALLLLVWSVYVIDLNWPGHLSVDSLIQVEEGRTGVIKSYNPIFITIVFLWLFHYDMSLNIIAAILTIAGYSVNDTIVVFDRVRENLRTMRREPLDEVVNKSVNQTLGRTIITSGVTFLAVLALYLFGGEVLRGFAFTMMIGVVTGTYSTVFIAAAIAIILSRQTPTQGAAAAKARTARA